MAGLKDIDRRIKSARNTQKTTYAMKLVSASKLRKAQDEVKQGHDFLNSLLQILAELLIEKPGLDIEHALLTPKTKLRKVRLLVIGSNKGLCGSYTANLNKKIDSVIKKLKSSNIDYEAVVIGKKVKEYFDRHNLNYLKEYSEIGDNVSNWPLNEIIATAQSDFVNDDIDELLVLYTNFKSALSMQAVSKKLLPLSAEELLSKKSDSKPGLTKFEPSPAAVFEAALPKIVTAYLRQASLSSKTGEHASRMTAMDAATKNAGELIKNLRRTYNKLRQGSITSQILDIVGGAEAVK